MKAVVQRAYGSPDEVLEVADVPRPVPAPDEVLVRVRAASLHPDVWHVVRGYPLPLRLMGSGLRRPENPIPGTDLAGIVEAVGEGVRRFRPGEAVFGESVRGHQWLNGGAFAEFATVPVDKLARKPALLSFEEAAAVPTSGLIALKGVRDEGRVRSGQAVLVNGAGGGVGIFALQIAKAYGAKVTAVDAGAKADMLRSLGADRVIDYAREAFTEGDERYDLIVDIPGNRPFSAVRRVLAPTGVYVLIGHDVFGARGGRLFGSMGRVLALSARTPFTRQLPPLWPPRRTREPLLVLADLADQGRLRPVVDRMYPLSAVPEAIAYLATGDVRGKVVISLTGSQLSA